MPTTLDPSVYPPQEIQWWNILLIVIGVIIILLLTAVLRVSWSLLKNKKEEEVVEMKPMTDSEFGKALAAKVMGSNAVKQFQ